MENRDRHQEGLWDTIIKHLRFSIKEILSVFMLCSCMDNLTYLSTTSYVYWDRDCNKAMKLKLANEA